MKCVTPYLFHLNICAKLTQTIVPLIKHPLFRLSEILLADSLRIRRNLQNQMRLSTHLKGVARRWRDEEPVSDSM